MAKTSPTARALKDLRTLGFTAGVVEKWIPQMRRRQDFLGCIDIVACREGVGVLGVQATANSGGNHASRIAKAVAEPRLRAWLASGARFEVWSYAKQGARGKRKTWTLRRQELSIDDLSSERIPPPGRKLSAAEARAFVNDQFGVAFAALASEPAAVPGKGTR